MQPLDDNHLKEILRNKLRNYEPDEISFQWDQIENKLPGQNTGIKHLAWLALILVCSIAIVPYEVTDKQIQQTNQPNNQCVSIGHDNDTHIASPYQYTTRNISNSHVTKTTPVSQRYENRTPAKHRLLGHVNLDAVRRSFNWVDTTIVILQIPVPTDSSDLTASPDETKKDKIDNTVYLSFGIFLNNNRYTPVQNDLHYLSDFDQSNNFFQNRLGYELTLRGSKMLFTRHADVSPYIRYSFLHKKYDVNYKAIEPERPGLTERLHEDGGYHFLSVGFRFTPMNFNKKYALELGYTNKIAGEGLSFGTHQINIGIARTWPLNKHPFDVYFEITQPIGGSKYFNMNMLNLGVRFDLASFKF